LIRVENVYASLAFLLEKFGEQTKPTTATISERASIDPSVKMGKNVAIGDFVIIEAGTTIGDDVRLYGQVYIGKNVSIGVHSIVYAGVKIYNDCIIGDRCILQSGAVIGSDGFGFAPQADGTYKKIHHAGNVILEDDVEVGANTTIDRGSIGATMIRRGVKLDNLIQVAHNVEIGENTVIAAQTGIAGSTKIGKNGRIGGQVGFGGHLIIGDFVQIQGQAGVINNQPDNVKLNGTPAIDFMSFMRSYTVFKKLPQMLKQITALEKRNDTPSV
jgi:UDP-3-O-[3-hydroxymyristoyl] glucosamine N-acyltransferase